MLGALATEDHCFMTQSLLDYVLAELQQRKGTWRAICRKTGLDYSWLTKFAEGKIDDPGVRKIQLLADYFRRNPRKRTRAA